MDRAKRMLKQMRNSINNMDLTLLQINYTLFKQAYKGFQYHYFKNKMNLYILILKRFFVKIYVYVLPKPKYIIK